MFCCCFCCNSHGCRTSAKPKRTRPKFEQDILNDKQAEQRAKEKQEKKEEQEKLLNQERKKVKRNKNKKLGINTNTIDLQQELLEEKSCRKHFQELNGRPIQFIARCALHGIKVGSYMITKAESVNDVFSFLYVFYQEPPDIVVADWMCRCHYYSWIRAPWFWKLIQVAVDSLHILSHMCSEAYNIQLRKVLSELWRFLMDQACEQRNSMLNKLRIMGVYMRKETFLLHTELLSAMDNRRILQRFFPNGIERTDVESGKMEVPDWQKTYDELYGSNNGNVNAEDTDIEMGNANTNNNDVVIEIDEDDEDEKHDSRHNNDNNTNSNVSWFRKMCGFDNSSNNNNNNNSSGEGWDKIIEEDYQYVPQGPANAEFDSEYDIEDSYDDDDFEEEKEHLDNEDDDDEDIDDTGCNEWLDGECSDESEDDVEIV